jgi:hypothetical protein
MLLELVSQTEGITALGFDGGALEEACEVRKIDAVLDVFCISLKPSNESVRLPQDPRRLRHPATAWVQRRPEIRSIGNLLTELYGRILHGSVRTRRHSRAVLGAARDPHSGNDLEAEAGSDSVALVLADPEAPAHLRLRDESRTTSVAGRRTFDTLVAPRCTIRSKSTSTAR